MEWLFSLVYPTSKNKIADQIYREMASYLDVIQMIKKINEIEILKSMLLDTNQRILFDNLYKPKIKIIFDETPSGQVYFDFARDEIIKGFHNSPELVNPAYLALKQEGSQNQVTKKLLDQYAKLNASSDPT